MKRRDESDLFRIIYRSRSAITGTPEEVQATINGILATSRRRNAEAGITGALMFTSLFFVQALEGSAPAVEATFDRICCDLRHVAVEVVECGPVLEATFGDWSMSYLVPEASAGATLHHLESSDDLTEAAAQAVKLMASLLRSGPDRHA